MPRELFDEVAHPSAKVGSRAWYVLPLSILGHALVAAVVIVVPLVAADVLPSPASVIAFRVQPPPPVPPPPPPRAEQAPQRAASATPVTRPGAVITEAQNTIPPELPGVSVDPGVPGGTPGGVTIPGAPPVEEIVKVPTPSPVVAQGPLRTGGIIKNPQKTHNVQPVYPAIAIANKVEGRVTIEATISTDGRVIEARVIGSRPLLDQAALDAVRQWRFTPTLLNGVPVPVIMTVTVDFKLQ